MKIRIFFFACLVLFSTTCTSLVRAQTSLPAIYLTWYDYSALFLFITLERLRTLTSEECFNYCRLGAMEALFPTILARWDYPSVHYARFTALLSGACYDSLAIIEGNFRSLQVSKSQISSFLGRVSDASIRNASVQVAMVTAARAIVAWAFPANNSFINTTYSNTLPEMFVYLLILAYFCDWIVENETLQVQPERAHGCHRDRERCLRKIYFSPRERWIRLCRSD